MKKIATVRQNGTIGMLLFLVIGNGRNSVAHQKSRIQKVQNRDEHFLKKIYSPCKMTKNCYSEVKRENLDVLVSVDIANGLDLFPYGFKHKIFPYRFWYSRMVHS